MLIHSNDPCDYCKNGPFISKCKEECILKKWGSRFEGLRLKVVSSPTASHGEKHNKRRRR